MFNTKKLIKLEEKKCPKVSHSPLIISHSKIYCSSPSSAKSLNVGHTLGTIDIKFLDVVNSYEAVKQLKFFKKIEINCQSKTLKYMLSLKIILPLFMAISTCKNFKILYLQNYYFVNQSIPKTIEIRVLCKIQKKLWLKLKIIKI